MAQALTHIQRFNFFDVRGLDHNALRVGHARGDGPPHTGTNRGQGAPLGGATRQRMWVGRQPMSHKTRRATNRSPRARRGATLAWWVKSNARLLSAIPAELGNATPQAGNAVQTMPPGSGLWLTSDWSEIHAGTARVRATWLGNASG